MNRKYSGQSDEVERQIAIKWLASLGWEYIPEGEQYSKYDLKFKKADRFLKIELEHRFEFKHFIDAEGWYDFPYSTIHVPARKEASEANLYLIFNRDRSQILMLRMDQIKVSPVIKVALNRPDSLGIEDFYDVALNTNKWKVVELDKSQIVS